MACCRFWLFFTVQLVASFAQRIGDTSVIYEWRAVDYAFASDAERQSFIASGRFIVPNCVITGVKQFGSDIFVTVPRWKKGVPSTLNRVVTVDVGGVKKPLLQPFPSWSMNAIANTDGLRYVQSMEIDTHGRMWIIDVGRLNIFDSPADVVNGPPKIVVYDLIAQQIIRTFVFPNAVAHWNSSFLNDIAVDQQRGFAYISDASENGAIIIYDFNKNQARRWSGPGMAVEPGVRLNISGKLYDFQTPVDGIALTPDTETLFYCPLTGFHLYSVPTSALRDFSLSEAAISAQAVDHGKKASQSDGLAFDANGVLYFGLLSLNGVNKWQWRPGASLSTQSPLLPHNATTLQWVDTFAFDNQGYLLYTSNKLQLFFTGGLVFNSSANSNFRVLKTFIGSNSYLTAQPPLPTPSNTSVSRATFIAVTVVVTGLALIAGAVFGAAAARSATFDRCFSCCRGRKQSTTDRDSTQVPFLS